MTKNLTTLLLAVFLFSSFGNKNNPDYRFECLSSSDGYLTIKIWDTKKGAKYKFEDAQKDAVLAILFSGIDGANGCTTQPPILSSSVEQEKFKHIEKSFFAAKGNWKNFVRSSTTETTLPSKLGAKNWKIYQVSVSKNELRKYLEEQKIINSLSNGF